MDARWGALARRALSISVITRCWRAGRLILYSHPYGCGA
jgi:hypothetical protein